MGEGLAEEPGMGFMGPLWTSEWVDRRLSQDYTPHTALFLGHSLSKHSPAPGFEPLYAPREGLVPLDEDREAIQRSSGEVKWRFTPTLGVDRLQQTPRQTGLEMVFMFILKSTPLR